MYATRRRWKRLIHFHYRDSRTTALHGYPHRGMTDRDSRTTALHSYPHRGMTDRDSRTTALHSYQHRGITAVFFPVTMVITAVTATVSLSTVHASMKQHNTTATLAHDTVC